MLVNVEMDKYVTGKRSKKKYTKKFKIAEDLWKQLCDFAANNELCTRGSYDYNHNTLYLVKTGDLLGLLKKECRSASELEFYDDFRNELYGANIIVEKTFVDYTFKRHIERIDSFGFAYFLKNDLTGSYKVKLSDQVRSTAESGDLAEITVLANKKMIVTEILRDDQADLQRQKSEYSKLLGGY